MENFAEMPETYRTNKMRYFGLLLLLDAVVAAMVLL